METFSDVIVELFRFQNEINKRFLICFENNEDKVPDKALLLMSHVINAQHIWNARILDLPQAYKVFEVHSLSKLKSIQTDNNIKTEEIINGNKLSQVLSYTNSAGKSYQNSVKEILLHVCNHSTYHRGQINSLLRQNGINPVICDYIAYKRPDF